MDAEKGYLLKKPFCFMKNEYTDSSSLADEFLKNWDIAISVFRRGDLLDFWTEYVEDDGEREQEAAKYFRYAYNVMWESARKEDVVFQKVIHYMAPIFSNYAFVPWSRTGVEWIEEKRLLSWVADQYEDGKYKPAPKKLPEEYSSYYFSQLWIDAALEEGILPRDRIMRENTPPV